MGQVEAFPISARRTVQEYPLLRSELMSITHNAGFAATMAAMAVTLMMLGGWMLLSLTAANAVAGIYPLLGGVGCAVASFRSWWALHRMVNQIIAETEPAVRGVANQK